LVLAVVALVVVPQPLPMWLTLTLVVYFVVVAVGASLAFVRRAARTTGVTRRRLECVAWGSGLLGLDIFVAGLGAILPALAGVWTILGGLLGLGSGVLYFVGFAPPVWVRRTWQEPALRAFLLRSAQLVREPDTDRVLRGLEEGTATALGAQAALDLGPPTHAAPRVELRTGTVLSAPVAVGSQHFGVLTAHAARAPIFADSDLELLELLADQAAVVLQSRELIEESARARARDEANRLKDEFLANISHDLRNPLTAVRGVAQVLERRLERDAVIDPERLAASLRNITASTAQMATLIDQLLDYARLQMERPLELSLTPTDLLDLARRTVDSYAAASDRHQVRLQAPAEPIIGDWDGARLERVVQNLVGNALKYSPQGGEVLVGAAVEHDGDQRWAVITVQDHGLGIPAADVPHIFDRFHRAANVAEIPGSGLGLTASRQIVEQHGGSVSVTSEVGQGTTFVVRLPLNGRLA
jgi:signal transduction histidine kinase